MKNMPFCHQCGNRVPEDAKFCATCGAKVVPAVEEPVLAPPVEESVIVPVVEEPVYELPVQEPVYQQPVEYPAAPVVEEAPVFTAPAEPEYVPPVVERSAPAKEKVSLVSKKPLGIGKIILVVCLCVLTFIFATATLATLCVQSIANEDTVALILEEVDLSEMAASTIIGNADEDDNIVDWLRAELIKRDPAWENLSTKEMEDFIDSQIKPFLAEEGAEFLEVMLTGKGEASIDIKDIRKLVSSSSDYIFEEYGVYVTDGMQEDIVSWVDSYGIEEYASTEYLEEEIPEIMEIIPLVASALPLAIFGGLTALFLVLILLTNKSLIRNLNSVGIVATLVGILFAGFDLVLQNIPNLLSDLLGDFHFIGAMIVDVINSGFTLHLIVLLSGIAMLLISKLLQSIKVTKK